LKFTKYSICCYQSNKRDTAAEEINAAGGILGIPIKLTWYYIAYDTAKISQQMGRVPVKNCSLSLVCREIRRGQMYGEK